MMKAFVSILSASMMALAVASPTPAPEAEIESQLMSEVPNVFKRAINPNSVNAMSEAQLNAQRQALILAGSEEARLNLLFPSANGANFTYQFVNNTVRAPTGGTVFLGVVGSFPGLFGTDISAGVGFVNPCGLNTAHSHPRANEFLIVTQGTLQAGLILEQDLGYGNVVGGAPPTVGPIRQIGATLSNYTGFLFPKGLTHFQFNPNCEPAVFVAAFDSSDPGRAEAAHAIFSISPDDINLSGTGYSSALTTADLDTLRNNSMNTAATIIQSCAQRCGIPYQKRSDFEYQ